MTNLMHVSQAGLDLIKSFEGYLDRMPDGSCRAYLCPADVWTIGWGCTEGVTEGLVWTRQQAEEGLRRELIKHENAIKKLVTVDLNQNEFDALVSFTYNVGAGGAKNPKTGEITPGLSTSTLLRCLNAGDRAGAARAFALWNKGGGKVLPGLVKRRAREALLFETPVEAPQKPEMPQKVEASPSPVVVAAGRSRTVWAQLIALGGLVLTWMETATNSLAQIAIDAVAQVSKLEPVTKLSPNAKHIGSAVVVVGIALAVFARIDAARKGKTG